MLLVFNNYFMFQFFSFQPLPPPYYPPRSRSSSLNSVPTPVPPQIRAHRYVNLPITSPSEVSEMYMDETHELCKSVTEHALEGKIL